MIPLVLVIWLTVVVLLWCSLVWWPRRDMWALAEEIPGPPAYPLIGNLPMVALMGKITNVLPEIMKLFDDYGSVVRGWVGPHLMVLVKDPEDIQHILLNPKIKNRSWAFTKVMSPLVGDGLLCLGGDRWKIHKTLVMPSFNYKFLESYIEIFGKKSQMLMDKLDEFEGRSFDAYHVLSLCTLDTICETVIGTPINSLADGDNPLAKFIQDANEYVLKRVSRPWEMIDFIYALSFNGRRLQHLLKVCHEFSEKVIAQKLAEYRRGVRSPSITTASNKKVSSFLDMLIEASEADNSILSPEEMRDEVTTMAVAGMETSATSMSFFLVVVALHHEVQTEIQKELDQVFGKDTRPATSEDLQQLQFLERCIKESLRLFHVAPFLARDIDEDLKLPSGYTLPAKTSVLCFAYATHLDARNFVDPNKFWPDRWLPENMKNVHPYAYLPFSAGHRKCVGQKYAILQMKSILGHILRRYRVTTPLTMHDLHNVELGFTLSMSSKLKNRYHIQLHKRG